MLTAVPIYSSPESLWMYSSLWSSNGIYTVSSARNNHTFRIYTFYVHTGDKITPKTHRGTRDCRGGWISRTRIASTCRVSTWTAQICSRPPRPRLERRWRWRVCGGPGPVVRGKPASGWRKPSWWRRPALACTGVLKQGATMRRRKIQPRSACS